MDEDELDYCYECGGYGDDYSVDEHGELVCNCDTCPKGIQARREGTVKA